MNRSSSYCKGVTSQANAVLWRVCMPSAGVSQKVWPKHIAQDMMFPITILMTPYRSFLPECSPDIVQSQATKFIPSPKSLTSRLCMNSAITRGRRRSFFAHLSRLRVSRNLRVRRTGGMIRRRHSIISRMLFLDQWEHKSFSSCGGPVHIEVPYWALSYLFDADGSMTTPSNYTMSGGI